MQDKKSEMMNKAGKHVTSKQHVFSSAKATVRGAISLVNALAAKKGATVGIDLEVNVQINTHSKSGGGSSGSSDITVIRSKENQPRSLSSKLIQSTIQHTVPKKILESNRVEVVVASEIPAGFGLKSSSSLSSAVALAASRAFNLHLTDKQILLAGVNASIATKVSVTGAYDDACSCYYGGFNVTDNAMRHIVQHQRAPRNISAIIFIPRNRKRGNLKRLKLLESTFLNAWTLAKQANYWDAMMINGLAIASVWGSDADMIPHLIEKGAIAASISGNGPAIAAVAKKQNVQSIRKAFTSMMEGSTIVSKLNNKKAEVNDIL